MRNKTSAKSGKDFWKELREEMYFPPGEHLIPELLLLGTLGRREICLDTGVMLEASVIIYNNCKYIMVVKETGRWYDAPEYITCL